MTAKADKYVEDVLFILEECARLQRVAMAGEFHQIAQKDAWFSLPHPSGQGLILCGHAAEERLEALSEAAGRRAGLLHRVQLQTLRKPLGELLIQRFVRERREISRGQVDRMLSKVGQEARGKCRSIIHFIPCHLMRTPDPERLQIGPVTFLNREAFDRRLRGKRRAYHATSEDTERKWAKKLTRDAFRYYRSFSWVAEVRIDGCDDGTSEGLAEASVTSALDCFQVLIGAQWTNRMRVGGPAIPDDRRGKLRLVSDELAVALSLQGQGQVNFEDGWSQQVVQPRFARPIELFGIALEAALNPDLARPLSRRFLDAAQWFGEAATLRIGPRSIACGSNTGSTTTNRRGTPGVPESPGFTSTTFAGHSRRGNWLRVGP